MLDGGDELACLRGAFEVQKQSLEEAQFENAHLLQQLDALQEQLQLAQSTEQGMGGDMDASRSATTRELQTIIEDQIFKLEHQQGLIDSLEERISACNQALVDKDQLLQESQEEHMRSIEAHASEILRVQLEKDDLDQLLHKSDEDVEKFRVMQEQRNRSHDELTAMTATLQQLTAAVQERDAHIAQLQARPKSAGGQLESQQLELEASSARGNGEDNETPRDKGRARMTMISSAVGGMRTPPVQGCPRLQPGQAPCSSISQGLARQQPVRPPAVMYRPQGMPVMATPIGPCGTVVRQDRLSGAFRHVSGPSSPFPAAPRNIMIS